MPGRTVGASKLALARSVLHHWQLGAADLTLLACRENAVFGVTSGSERYALRVHRPGYHTGDVLRSELQWLQALSDGGLDVPVVVPARTGELFVTGCVEGLAGPVHADLFEWIDGQQLGAAQADMGHDPQWINHAWHELGVLAAGLHDQAAGWQAPAGFTRPAWDEHGLAGAEPLWGRFWELPFLHPEERALLCRARERVQRDLAALSKAPASYSMIHGDLLPENVLVDGGRLRLIDFDDAGFGWHLFELVTPLYSIMDEPWFEQARDALIAGYRSRRPLADSELERLPLFFLARSLTDIGWMHTRAKTDLARRSIAPLVESACELAENYLRRR
jgi:Ser/Thr protein kinase RdoA (MazF antagonist)